MGAYVGHLRYTMSCSCPEIKLSFMEQTIRYLLFYHEYYYTQIGEQIYKM